MGSDSSLHGLRDNIGMQEELNATNAAKRSANALVATLNAEIDDLRDELDATKKKLAESEAARAKQKGLLREWMVSQTAFRNLFMKYGRTDDGRKIVDMPEDERNKIADEEHAAVGRTIPNT